MVSHLKLCPSCGFDLERVQGVLDQEALAFCPQCQFPLPLVASKYRLVKELWRGGSSIVYLSLHIHLDQDAERVIKVIRPEIFKIQGMEHRFRREVQITSALSQRNEHIVRIYDDFGEIPKLGHFYVMEHLQGETLSQLLEELAELPPLPFCFHLFMQLCDTMQFAHETGVVHRDLKPHNLMLVQRKNDPFFLKVYDFGIAKPVSNEELAVTHVTQGSLGTPAYMAPEQCLNQPTDVRTDIYAMGIMLYEMLVGHTPFLPPQGEMSAFSSAVGIIEGHLTKEPPSPRSLQPERVSPELERVVLKALAKKPDERFQTAEELRLALEAVAQTWSESDQVLLEKLSSEKISVQIPLMRKPAVEPTGDWSLVDEQMDHHTWHLGASSRVQLSGQDGPDSSNSPAPAPKAAEENAEPEVVLSELLLDDSHGLPKDTVEVSSMPVDLLAALDAEKKASGGETLGMPALEWADTSVAPDPPGEALPSDLLPADEFEEGPTAVSRELPGAMQSEETPAPTRVQNHKATQALSFSVSQVLEQEGQAESGRKPLFRESQAEESAISPVTQVQKVLPGTDSGAIPTLRDGDSELPVLPPPIDSPATRPQPILRAKADRIQGPHNGLLRMFVEQRADWESDPFLVKNLMERISALQTFIESDDFARLYPYCQGRIVLEAHSFPPEIANRLVQEGIELRLLPKITEPENSDHKITLANPAPALSIAPSASPTKPKAQPVSVPTPAPKVAPRPVPTPLPVSSSPDTTPSAVPAAMGGAVMTARTVPSPTTPPPSYSANLQGPVDAPVPGHTPTPVALWDDYDDNVLNSSSTGSSVGMWLVIGLFVLSLVGIVYGMGGNSSEPKTTFPSRVITSQVSANSLPAASYVTATVTPDRATFVLIPVVDNESGQRDVYVLFAAKENRRVLVFAPYQQSQVLDRIKETRDPEGINQGQMTPIWSKDLRGSAPNPRSRNYMGSLEKLQRYPGGPLELVLPDGHRNINKIPGYRQHGVQFPMDSMILRVGERPKPPTNPYRSVVLVLSLLLALVSAGSYMGLRNRMQQPF
ncbi:MAG: hypothetical protein EP343_03930 [Deltaproteobacteria bacterium]|nr:MAG: hypothetical protein EP343_03930 [Deltaproteobacteria bacterium]